MRIRQIWVRGLFGLFDYDIPLNLDERVTIMIGPNGSGKTTLLAMLNSLLTGDFSSLSSEPFAELGIVLDDGSRLTVAKLGAGGEDDNGDQAPNPLEFRFGNGPEAESYKWPEPPSFAWSSVPLAEPWTLSVPVEGWLDKYVPWVTRIGPQTWVDQRTGQHLSASQAMALSALSVVSDPESLPEWLTKLRSALTVRFVGTKRLQRPAETTPYWGVVLRNEGEAVAASAVELYSKHVAKIIQSTLAEYAERSQTLDRTFPTRLVERTPQADLDPADLRRRLEDLESKRSRLVAAGLLDEDKDGPLQLGPSRDVVDDKTRSVLSVHVRDTAEKLAAFDGLAARIDLLKAVVNKRFSHKQLSIDKEQGFKITTDKGRQLKSDELSSGEQHELVLLSEFLFETKPGSLILIDEPEISFHVAWQREFLKDISEIAKLVGFDALIATHSPQIIADRWDLKVELEEKPVAQPNPE